MFGRREPSQAQTEANRRDAQHSTGPKTEAAKNRSKNNVLRHGLTAQVTVMTEPDREAHDKFIKAHVADIAPRGFQENQLAQSLAHDQWPSSQTQSPGLIPWKLLRRRGSSGQRIRAIEENAFFPGLDGPAGHLKCEHPEIHTALAQAGTFFNEPESFATLSLYEQRIHRNFHRNLKLFKDLRNEREENRTTHASAEVEQPKAMTAGASATATQPADESTTSPEIGFVRSNPDSHPSPAPQTAPNPTADPAPDPYPRAA